MTTDLDRKARETHLEVLRAMFQQCANNRQMMEADAIAAGIDALRLAVPDGGSWTDAQCAEFMSVAMRHCEVRGEFSWHDIRMGQRRANMIAADPTLADEGES